jgi:hypothetical protein
MQTDPSSGLFIISQGMVTSAFFCVALSSVGLIIDKRSRTQRLHVLIHVP